MLDYPFVCEGGVAVPDGDSRPSVSRLTGSPGTYRARNAKRTSILVACKPRCDSSKRAPKFAFNPLRFYDYRGLPSRVTGSCRNPAWPGAGLHWLRHRTARKAILAPPGPHRRYRPDQATPPRYLPPSGRPSRRRDPLRRPPHPRHPRVPRGQRLSPDPLRPAEQASHPGRSGR